MDHGRRSTQSGQLLPSCQNCGIISGGPLSLAWLGAKRWNAAAVHPRLLSNAPIISHSGNKVNSYVSMPVPTLTMVTHSPILYTIINRMATVDLSFNLMYNELHGFVWLLQGLARSYLMKSPHPAKSSNLHAPSFYTILDRMATVAKKF